MEHFAERKIGQSQPASEKMDIPEDRRHLGPIQSQGYGADDFGRGVTPEMPTEAWSDTERKSSRALLFPVPESLHQRALADWEIPQQILLPSMPREL